MLRAAGAAWVRAEGPPSMPAGLSLLLGDTGRSLRPLDRTEEQTVVDFWVPGFAADVGRDGGVLLELLPGQREEWRDAKSSGKALLGQY